jgi:hypothetical protein
MRSGEDWTRCPGHGIVSGPDTPATGEHGVEDAR